MYPTSTLGFRRRFSSLVSNPHSPHYHVSWWYSDQLSMMLPSSAAQPFHENPWHEKRRSRFYGREKRRSRLYVPNDLWTTKCVLVRADKVQSSLVPKYTGPFLVLRRWKKCFGLQLESQEDTSTDYGPSTRTRRIIGNRTPKSSTQGEATGSMTLRTTW